MQKYKDKNILILGMGKSGQSMVHFFNKRGAFTQSFDDKVKDTNFEGLCPIYSKIKEVNFSEIDLIGASPGIAFSHPIYQQAREHGIPVLGEVEIGVRAIKNPCIGITGTNGKSTTTSLIAHLLNSVEIKARAVGNIGTPITSIVGELEEAEIVVIELSSYQIDQLKTSFLDVALLLNITPDHLDRYINMECYAKSKFNIQDYMKRGGTFFISEELIKDWGEYLHYEKTRVFNDPDDFNNTLLNDLIASQKMKIGPVEKKNYLAALCVCNHFYANTSEIIKGIKTFEGLPHRSEYVTAFNGLTFYNDSKATNIEAVIKAVTSFDKPLIMIMGGDDKNLDYSILKAYFLNKVKDICLIGQVKHKMADVFKDEFMVHICDSLEDAVKKAYEVSKQEDIVLLSPGTSSFDMFRNFESRGESFKEIVQQLEGEKNESP
jgi:UDP-N-acetylmuramoylalanine--D-glutamate ligase